MERLNSFGDFHQNLFDQVEYHTTPVGQLSSSPIPPPTNLLHKIEQSHANLKLLLSLPEWKPSAVNYRKQQRQLYEKQLEDLAVSLADPTLPSTQTQTILDEIASKTKLLYELNQSLANKEAMKAVEAKILKQYRNKKRRNRKLAEIRQYNRDSRDLTELTTKIVDSWQLSTQKQVQLESKPRKRNRQAAEPDPSIELITKIVKLQQLRDLRNRKSQT